MNQDLIAYALFEARMSITRNSYIVEGWTIAKDSIARALQGNSIDFDRQRFENIATTGSPE